MPRLPFIATVILILGALHVFIGSQLLHDLPLSETGRLLGWLLLLASWLLIPVGLLARMIQRESMADKLAWIGLMAMGFFSSLLVLTFVRSLALLIFGFVEPVSPAWVANTAIAVPLITLLITIAGYFNARRVAQVVAVEVPVDNLPDALDGFTIAQISDIHVGPTIKRRYLERIVDRVNSLQADVVAVTGDVVDGSVADLAEHTAPLADLKGRLGTYLVTGNHEYYSNAGAWVAEFTRLGLRVLMNEHVVVDHRGASVLVAGVTDYKAHQFYPEHRSDPHKAISGAPQTISFKLLLAHQPRTATAAAQAGFDLQLSGHTHGGQFFPWNLFVPLQQPYVAGLNRLESLWVYTSRGTGYWGPPKRFGAPSEITHIRLVKGATRA
ncbi:MAG: metallophosphoesterase [Burkholderiales bacterium]|nr:metallophosphoesterase [Burkholderiales bacterium]